MKKIIATMALCVALLSVPAFYSGCSTPVSQRVVEAQTLGVLGQTAKAAMDTATQLLKDGKITVSQWQGVANFYDAKWQPAFNVAVTAVSSNLDSIASPDLQNLATQFGNLVLQLQSK